MNANSKTKKLENSEIGRNFCDVSADTERVGGGEELEWRGL